MAEIRAEDLLPSESIALVYHRQGQVNCRLDAPQLSYTQPRGLAREERARLCVGPGARCPHLTAAAAGERVVC